MDNTEGVGFMAYTAASHQGATRCYIIIFLGSCHASLGQTTSTVCGGGNEAAGGWWMYFNLVNPLLLLMWWWNHSASLDFLPACTARWATDCLLYVNSQQWVKKVIHILILTHAAASSTNHWIWNTFALNYICWPSFLWTSFHSMRHSLFYNELTWVFWLSH